MAAPTPESGYATTGVWLSPTVTFGATGTTEFNNCDCCPILNGCGACDRDLPDTLFGTANFNIPGYLAGNAFPLLIAGVVAPNGMQWSGQFITVNVGRYDIFFTCWPDRVWIEVIHYVWGPGFWVDVQYLLGVLVAGDPDLECDPLVAPFDNIPSINPPGATISDITVTE